MHVYDRSVRHSIWTCDPSDYVRDKAQDMEFKREITAQERWMRISPAGSHNAHLAAANVSTLRAAQSMLNVPDQAPVSDPVLVRIDSMGIAL